uniref:Uncharacterized protein n=1 Tax=viral metagenome TaxID=1070528 RepID=A0A6C0CFE2_9ZZZZ
MNTCKSMNKCKSIDTCNSMNTCKANACVRNKNLVYPKNVRLRVWNDFERCNKNVYKDGFCKICYEPDKRLKNINWIDDQRWKRDGIYGQPYDFPFHTSPKEKEWVEMMYVLHPHLKPVNKFWKDLVSIEDRKQMLDVIKDNLSDEEILYLCEKI